MIIVIDIIRANMSPKPRIAALIAKLLLTDTDNMLASLILLNHMTTFRALTVVESAFQLSL